MRRQALVFRTNALAGTQSYAASASTDDAASGGGDGGSVHTSQSISSETDYDPWPEIERQTAALAGPGTVAAAAPSIASLLVSGPPRDIRRVRAYLAWLNREVLRPVTLSVHVYSVIVAYGLMNASFKLIDLLPGAVLDWIGGRAGAGDDGSERTGGAAVGGISRLGAVRVGARRVRGGAGS